MSSELNYVEQELSQAGESSEMSKLLIKLDKCRIMTDTQVPPEEFLIRMFGKPCFPRRELTAITGTEKCGKTFYTTMLMACAVGQEKVLALERMGQEPLKVLWYDTEQSKASTKHIMTDRILKLAKTDEDALNCQLFVFNVRHCSYQPRNAQGQYMTNKPEAYQVSEGKTESFCQDYIIHNGANARLSWEWDLRKLFGDAMGDRAIMGLDDLQRSVMSLSGIIQPKYYDKVFRLALDQRIVQTTTDRYGRVVVVPVT